MPIESANFISQLVTGYPKGSDQRATLDNHARLIKLVLTQTLPGLGATVSATPQALNFCVGLSANAQQQLNTLAAQIPATSANLHAQILSTSSSLNANLLNLSETAYAAVRWSGGQKYIQTATPVGLLDNDVWMKPE